MFSIFLSLPQISDYHDLKVSRFFCFFFVFFFVLFFFFQFIVYSYTCMYSENIHVSSDIRNHVEWCNGPG